MKIYGSKFSVFSHKVSLIATYLDLDYDLIYLDLGKGEGHSKEHLNRHPAGKIPVLDDNGFILFESDSIARYLTDKNESELFPREIKKRYLVDQWNQFVTSHITANGLKKFFNLFIAPLRNMPVDQQSLSDGDKFLKRFLPILDHQLSLHKNLVSDDLSIADMNLGTTLYFHEKLEIDLSLYPNLHTWYQTFISEDFYVKWKLKHKESIQTSKDEN